MAKNTIADLDTTASNNTDVLNQSTQGTAAVSTIDTMIQNSLGLLARFYADLGGLGTVGGTADAITLTTASTYQTLENGITLSFKAGSAITGASTINVDGLGDKAIRRIGDSATQAGDIVANGVYLLRYDTAYNSAAGAWILLNAAGASAATTSAAGIVELATTTEALEASSATLAVTPAGLANLYSLALNNAIEIADLKGSRLNMAGGIADAYDSETDIDTATSTNESYDATNDLYSPTDSSTTEANANGTGSDSAAGHFTMFDLTWKIDNGATVTKIGAFDDNGAKSIPVKIGKRNSAGNFDILVSETLSHTGSGWEDKTLSSAFVVPGSGDYYVGWEQPSSGTINLISSQSRAYKAGATSVGNGQTGFTEDTSGIMPARVTYQGSTNNMTLASNAFPASAVPTVARLVCFIDPQESITINTDYTGEVSRDGGTTWTAVTLALTSNPVGTVEQYEGTVSIASQPSGSSMKYRKKTLNNKDIDDTGVVFQWG